MKKKVLAAIFLVAFCTGSVFGSDTITPGKGPGTSVWTTRLDTVWSYISNLF